MMPRQSPSRKQPSTPFEELRIGVLTLLHGGCPGPLPLLPCNFAHKDPYPIIDFRALWSLGIENRPQFYTFDYRWEYVQVCRELSEKCAVSMRAGSGLVAVFKGESEQE